ncbi:DUF3618 domain-containing protein [Aeromicrobium chenweiae]|uniref:DUF3618 domain-containing protein n=1 Tax=Aeromicrobium chenweiae TaxID=2079793 RepID=UPI001F3256CA|nr:DUF3618 domain-containing protein [Aeromicrobium chenweiae]
MIEHDIESSREDLSRNFDALADRVSPGRVVGRRVDSVKGRIAGAKDSVMGSASSMSDASGSAVGSLSDTAGAVSRRAEGNPLAAGLIAFGAGWLVSSLMPASNAEARLAGQAIDTAKEQGQPLVDHAKSVAQEVGDDLKGKAAEAASDVKDTATESAQHVKDEGQSAAEGVRNDVS